MVAKREFVTGLPEDFLYPYRKRRMIADALTDAERAPTERRERRWRRSFNRSPEQIEAAKKLADRIIGEGNKDE